jgi:hypothetical protein
MNTQPTVHNLIAGQNAKSTRLRAQRWADQMGELNLAFARGVHDSSGWGARPRCDRVVVHA